MKHAIINSILSGAPLSPLQKFMTTCEPMTIAAGSMAAAGAATQIMGQMQAKSAAEETEEAKRLEQERVVTETRRRATDDYLNQTRMEIDRQTQEEAAVAVKSGDVMRETKRTVATGTASAAERGVAGKTVEQIAADYDFMANEETGRLKANQALANQQHAENKRGMSTEYANRLADARPYVPKQQAPVDYFGPIFGVGQQALAADVTITKANPDAKTLTNKMAGKW